jgi:hypothetical protein
MEALVDPGLPEADLDRTMSRVVSYMVVYI